MNDTNQFLFLLAVLLCGGLGSVVLGRFGFLGLFGLVVLDGVGEIGKEGSVISLVVGNSGLNQDLSLIRWPLIKLIGWFLLLLLFLDLWLCGSSSWSGVSNSTDGGSWLSLGVMRKVLLVLAVQLGLKSDSKLILHINLLLECRIFVLEIEELVFQL